MEQPRRKTSERSRTRIIPPKRKAENLSRDEVRSINKKRIRRKRRFKKMVALFLMASAVLCVGVLLALTVFFKVNTVKITGSKVYADSQVLSESGIETGDSLFSVSEEKLNEILPKRLPYIKSVKITRKLPDTLTVEVTATRESAAFAQGDGYILVDDTGKILDTGASMLRENVAVVSGVEPKNVVKGEIISLGNEDVDDDFKIILATLKADDFRGVTEIVLTKDNEFKLVYEDRITIKLGSMNNLSDKLQRANAAIEKENQINPYSEGVLDLKIEPYAFFRAGAEEEETIPSQFVTNENGEVVTDDNGDFVTKPSESVSETEETIEE